jgi:glycerophosphoryl diester phosphodiesterase
MIIVLITSQVAPKSHWVEIQGHRGCRGLLPENTIPAYLKAIDIGVDTLEMDTVVSQDAVVLMSHEPWLNGNFCTNANGENITSESVAIDKYAVYHMPYEKISYCNCGHANAKFPMQTPMPIAKPRLADVFDSVEAYIRNNNKPKVMYNIETKIKPDQDNKLTPPVKQVRNFLHFFSLS